MKKIYAILCAIAMIGCSPAHADTLTVKTGPDDKSVYSQLFKQMAAVCATPTLVESPSGGSIQSLDSLLSNEASLAFIQSDVVIGRKTIENDTAVEKTRMFMPLFGAELHMITSRQNTSINRFSDLNMKKVGAYGGAYITGRILFGAAGIRPIQFPQFDSKDEALKALAAGTIDAVMIVEGQPASWAKSLSNQNFKLVSFDRGDLLGKLGAYSPSNLRYPNLSPTTVPSLSVNIGLFTMDYKSKVKVADLAKLKSCIANSIDDLRETTGNHPKWQEIKPGAKATYWPMFSAAAGK